MQDREEMIRERAYRIWVDQGQPEGKDQEHWVLASQEIEQQAAAPKRHSRAPAAKKTTRQRKPKT